MLYDVLNSIKRKLLKLRLQPIRVYCLHHVCAKFDEESMNRWDWMQLDELLCDRVGSGLYPYPRRIGILQSHPSYIPFWAYTYGEHTLDSDNYLRVQQIVPVYIEGLRNYNEQNLIHRELL